MENEFSVTIKKAELSDLEAVLELDAKISFDFFEPLYKKYYANTSLGKNPRLYLNSELKIDKQEFPKIINDPDYYFFVAKSQYKECLGFLIAHKISSLSKNGINSKASLGNEIRSKLRGIIPQKIQIDLLLVDEKFRGFGIGSKLINSLNGKILCTYVMKENESAIKFYKKLGFEIKENPNPNKLNSYGIRYDDMYFYMVKPYFAQI